jgi:hypothetical protein
MGNLNYACIVILIEFQIYRQLCDLESDGVGWDSVNGLVTGYKMEGPDFEIRWGQEFLHPSRTVLEPTQLPA